MKNVLIKIRNFFWRNKKKTIIYGSILFVFIIILIICLSFIKCDYKEVKNSYGIVSNYNKNKLPNNILIKNYNDYKRFWKNYSGYNLSTSKVKENDFEKYDYIVYFYKSKECIAHKNYPLEVKYTKNNLYIKSIEYTNKNSCYNSTYAYLIQAKKNYYKKIPTIKVEKQIVENTDKANEIVAKKPILYLYPTKKTNVFVTIKNSQNILVSYPKYQDGFNVVAYPNGDLYDKDNKYYYALYWDEKLDYQVDFNEGFYVDKENADEFLEEKLDLIGLSKREKNEFIMYWLPVLIQNKKSVVYFELTEERQKNSQIIIVPQPDSLLRVNMHIKKVDNKVKIKEQKLPKFERNGFVAVEWGGTNY